MRRAVSQADRRHRGGRVDGRLEHRRAEPAAGPATPRRPLREDRHDVSLSQRRRDPGHGARQGTRPGPVDEHRTGDLRQPTEHRPVPHLLLGHQPGRQVRQQHQDVQPGNVVGYHERAGTRPWTAQFVAYPKCHKQRPGQHVHGRRPPVPANRGMGSSSSRHRPAPTFGSYSISPSGCGRVRPPAGNPIRTPAGGPGRRQERHRQHQQQAGREHPGSGQDRQ